MVGIVLVREMMAVDISDVARPGLSNRDTFARSWSPDAATDDSSADVVADYIACMEMM